MTGKSIFIRISGQILFIVLFLELILWLVFPVPIEQEINIKFSQNIPGLKENIVYDRNKFGFRSLSMQTREKPKNTFRVICLGASTTDQMTQNTQDTWSGILEILLNKEFGKQDIRIEVAAFGRGGETVGDRLSWVKNYLLEFQPDMVITLQGINNLAHGGKFSKPKYELNRIKYQCLKLSQICRRVKLIKFRIQTYFAKKSGNVVEWHSKNLPELRSKYKKLKYVKELTREPDPINSFSVEMNALLGLLGDAGIDVIVMSQPVIWKENMSLEEKELLWFPIVGSDGSVRPGTKWLAEENNRYNNAQKQVADHYNMTFLDLDKKIPKLLEFFFDDCHFTDIGSKRVADEIFAVVYEKIKER